MQAIDIAALESVENVYIAGRVALVATARRRRCGDMSQDIPVAGTGREIDR